MHASQVGAYVLIAPVDSELIVIRNVTSS